MSRIVSDLKIRLGADIVELERKLKVAMSAIEKSQAAIRDAGMRASKMGEELTMKMTAPMAALGAVSVKLADVQAAAEAKVQQALQSTRGAAQLNYQQLTAYATKLQGKTLFGDEEILNKSTAQLLTFTNIAGENFKRAQAVAMDLATVLDGDLKGASIQLGKALNDPVTSLSALRKSGIQFTAEQEKLIKTLANSGQVAKAQAVILDELERQYGGQAEARAKAGAGAVVQMKNAWGDLMEMFGRVMMPTVNKVAKVIQSLVERLQQMSPTTQKLVIGFSAIAAATGPVLLGFGMVIKSVVATRVAILSLTAATAATPWGLIITAVAAAGAGLMMLVNSSNKATHSSTEHARAVADEGRKVNSLIAQLASANTAEGDRRKVLEELKSVQPSIVAGLGDEATKLDVLKQKAVEYNEQLVLRMALAKRQDAVDSAVERRNDAGVKKAEAQMALLEELGKIPAKIDKLEIGRLDLKKGITIWRNATQDEKANVLKSYSEIMASSDDVADKARKVYALLKSGSMSVEKVRVGTNKRILKSIAAVVTAEQELAEATTEVDGAMQGVVEFKDQFSKMLGVVDAGASSIGGWVDGLVKSVEAMDSAEVKVDAVKRAIKELNNKRADVTNPIDLEAIDNAVAKLQSMIVVQKQGTVGIIEKLQAKVKELEQAKLAATARADIERLNAALAETKSLLDAVSNVRSIGDTTSLAKGMKAQGAGVSINSEGIAPKIKVPDMSAAMNVYSQAVSQAGQFSGRIEKMANKAMASSLNAGVGIGNAVKGMAEKVALATEEAITLSEQLGNAIGDAMSDLGVGLLDSLGRMSVGDMGLDNMLDGIKMQIGDFMQQMGKLLITQSTAIKAFKAALSASWLSGPAGIAIGAGLVAAGAALKASIEKNAASKVPKLANGGLAYAATYAMVGDNPNARVDPEVIAPLSKLQEIIRPRGGVGVADLRITGELRARGQDLALVLGNASGRNKTMDEKRRG